VTCDPVEIWGTLAVGAMALFYALEARSHWFVLAFAAACLGSSAYAVAIRSWPFAAVELLWAGIAVRRWLHGRPSSRLRVHSEP
jgi:hypothetical protein